MQAVIAVPTLEAALPWPVAAAAPPSWLVVDGDRTEAEVGLFLAAAADGLDVPPSAGRDEIVDLVVSAETLLILGGVRLHDSETGAMVEPGCCNDLNDWREWLLVDAGRPPSWLGHDPSPEVEFIGDLVRVWQDSVAKRDQGPRAGLHVDLARAAVSAQLHAVQADLVGFLATLTTWAEDAGLGARVPALIETIDRHLAISAPLDLDEWVRGQR
ncbi:hypothetical protein Ais01nite_60020 [Asanoa ishikariensis]|uniref:Uncharacterized protein n=1 Tax=Asanoa ishikariensis TaxID=137265 RepID=A0A1H3PBK1_9ACTN|nr:hypothetical protein [Asanoa ishikariensis]GIF67967.1 hypothetical protein Ais01nite_60020 [Asanoa ishikariensis]SDY98185.1 hypothetical protein SAMN05421684_2727 [Asanoa ishikariensis]